MPVWHLTIGDVATEPFSPAGVCNHPGEIVRTRNSVHVMHYTIHAVFILFYIFRFYLMFGVFTMVVQLYSSFRSTPYDVQQDVV